MNSLSDLPLTRSHDDPGQRVPGVAVEVLAARREVEHFLMDHEVERRHRRMHLRSRTASLDAEQAPLIAQAARVRQQIADRDPLAAERRNLR